MPRSQFSDAYLELLQLLVSARETAGLTQTDLAARLNKPQPFVSKVERGVRRIDVIEFCVIARAIGIDPVDLFKSLLARVPRRQDI